MEDQPKKLTRANLNALPEKMVPKLCTHIDFSLTKDAHESEMVLITFSYQEPGQEERTVIDRIAITVEHSKHVLKTLTTVLSKTETKLEAN